MRRDREGHRTLEPTVSEVKKSCVELPLPNVNQILLKISSCLILPLSRTLPLKERALSWGRKPGSVRKGALIHVAHRMRNEGRLGASATSTKIASWIFGMVILTAVLFRPIASVGFVSGAICANLRKREKHELACAEDFLRRHTPYPPEW